MATKLDENPPKRYKISQEEGTVIDLAGSEDGNLDEDVELENQLRDVQADLDKVKIVSNYRISSLHARISVYVPSGCS